MVAIGDVYIRQEMSTDSPIVDVIYKGTQVTITKLEDDWYHIENGFVKEGFLE